MSYIQNAQGSVFNAGHFLAHEECTRVTKEIPQSLATTVGATKYVKAGTPFPSNDANAIGFVFEDTDVTTGNVAGSVVVKGEIIEAKLPVTLDSNAKTALAALGFKFVANAGAIRPEYPTSLKALTVSFAEASASGKTAPTVSGYTLRSTDKYLFKLGDGTSATNAPKVGVGEILTTGWSAWDGESAITVAAGDDGKYATIAVVNAFGEAIAAGSGAVDRKS